MRRLSGRHWALWSGSLVMLFLQGMSPIALHAAAPTVTIPEGEDTAPVTQAVSASGSGGGKWVVVATTSVAVPAPPSPSAPRIGVPTARDEVLLGDTGMKVDDTDGQEGEE